MSDSFLVSLQAESWLARLRGAPERLTSAMQTTVQRLSIRVQAAVKNKLSGGVLHVRTGTLRRSINREVNSTPTRVVATVGTNVKYAAVHEFGFNGDVTVRSHVRKVASRSIGAGKKQTVQGIGFVREHTRHMVIPERSYLRSTVREFQPQIKSELKAAALEAIR